MAIKQGRLGKGEYYEVKFVNDFPEDKIVVILDKVSGHAFVVSDYRKRVNDFDTEYKLSPISRLDKTHGLPDEKWVTPKEVLNNNNYEVLFLDTLNDFIHIRSSHCYN